MKRLAAALALLTTAAGAGVGVSQCAVEVAGALHSISSSQGKVIEAQQAQYAVTGEVLNGVVEYYAQQLRACREECE